MVNAAVTDPVAAARTAVCAVETGVALAVNCTLDVFACTIAAVVVVRDELLLEMPTLTPAAGAGPLSVTVQVFDALLHVNPVTTGGGSATPVPLRLTIVALVEAVEVIASCPVAAPTLVGAKVMVKL
jgi:hypothetical protein